jgi:hypothetical protein
MQMRRERHKATQAAALRDLEAYADGNGYSGFTDTQAGKIRIAEMLADGDPEKFDTYLEAIMGYKAEDDLLGSY